jgi:predicted transcriptional regulator
MSTKAKKGLRGSEAQAITRLLLALWDKGGTDEQVKRVKRKELTDQVKLNNERVKDYQGIFEQLQEKGAITIETKNKAAHVLLTETGRQMLDDGIKSPDFEFDGKELKARDKDVNALLRWFRKESPVGNGVISSADATKTLELAIASYEKFEHVALEVYDRLNQEHNMNDLVPIYRIRREIGDHASREHFNEWLLQMQENDIFQLMAGEMPDLTPDKRENSITIPGGGLRYYAKRLNS